MKPKIQVIETPKIKANGVKVTSPRFTTFVMDKEGVWHMIFKANLLVKKINMHPMYN